jgi:hypothetical protein
MSGLPEQMLEQMLHALRGPVLPDEALLLIGQLFAWHSLAQRGSLPSNLNPPIGEENLTPTMLSVAFSELERLDELKTLAVGFQGRHDSTYARLTPNELTALARVSQALVMLDQRECRQLVDAWAEAMLAAAQSHWISIPLEVAELVVRSLGLAEGQAIHCPGAGMDSIAIAAMRNAYEPCVESPAPPTVAAIYAAITGSKIRYLKGDPFRPDRDVQQFLKGVEACAAVPPRGERLDPLARLAKRPSRFGARTSEALGLEMVALEAPRESVVVVPNGVLGGRGPESELRRYLVENGPLKAVIGFPPNLLTGTGMAFSIVRLSPTASTEPVVFCKVDEERHLSAQGKVRSRDRRFIGTDQVLQLLVEPDGKLARRVPRDEIAAHDFVLTPERYLSAAAPLLASMWKETAPLGDLVTIIKPQFLKPDEDPEGVPIQEALPSDMPEFGHLERVERIRTVDKQLLKARNQQVLVFDDVLLSTKGTIGKVGIARPDRMRPPLLPSQASVILRLKPSASAVDPRFLVMYLRAPLVQQAIASFAVGGTIPNISLTDLRGLPVWVATPQEQKPFIEAFERQAALEAEVVARRALQANLAESVWREFRLMGAE